jgi:hypothetical protein
MDNIKMDLRYGGSMAEFVWVIIGSDGGLL